MSTSADRERDRGLQLNLAAIRTIHLGKQTDESLADQYLAVVEKALVMYFTDENNWIFDEYIDPEHTWGATTEVTYPTWLKPTHDPLERFKKKLSSALGSKVFVHEIEVDYRADFTYASILCTQIVDD